MRPSVSRGQAGAGLVELGKKSEYDATAGRVSNCPEAAPCVRREYRKGGIL